MHDWIKQILTMTISAVAIAGILGYSAYRNYQNEQRVDTLADSTEIQAKEDVNQE